MEIRYILTDKGHAVVSAPKRAHETDAGFDLSSTEKVEILPHGRELVDVGIAVEIAEGYAGLILPRSGLALKKGLSVLNAPGLIDSGYRGNVKVLLWNSGVHAQEVCAGDRIAQLVIVKVESPEIKRVDWLRSADRGVNGFGSTGS